MPCACRLYPEQPQNPKPLTRRRSTGSRSFRRNAGRRFLLPPVLEQRCRSTNPVTTFLGMFLRPPNFSESVRLRMGRTESDFAGAIQEPAQQFRIFCVLEKIHLLTGIRAASASPQISEKVLKRFLSIFSDLIFDSSVDRGMPNLAAAPVGPNTRPRVAFRASSLMFFSCALSFRGSSMWRFDSVAGSGRGNQLSSTERMSDSQRITERSITFCNSRIFPGQGYD